MDPEAASVAMLYQDPHPAHRGFADAVGADLVDYRRLSSGRLTDTLVDDVHNGLRYPGYDVYLVEGSRPLYAAVVHRAVRRSRLVYLCADHGLYELGRSGFEGDSRLKSLVGRFGRPLVRQVGRRFVDSVIAVSEFAAEFTRPLVGADTPTEVVNPYIQPDVYDRLGGVSPALDGATAVTVARPARYKGVDLLVDAWPAVRDRHPDATLHVVGEGHPESYDRVDGVERRGYLQSLTDAFSPAALFVQPSRMDTFPVAMLEAARAGLPPLVTTATGTRSVAREIDSSLVVDPTAEALAAGVAAYFGRSSGTRSRLSAAAAELGSTFSAEVQAPKFAAAFERIVETL